MAETIRVCLKIRPDDCEDLYRDLASITPRFRAGHIRSILYAHYKQHPGIPHSETLPAAVRPLEDPSLDLAMKDAFGDVLELQ